MAMDMLSRWGSLPIIVGDKEEVETMKGLEDRPDGVYLVLVTSHQERKEIKLQSVTTENVLSNFSFIVVALTKDDEIDWAFDCQIDDALDFTKGKDSTCGRPLTEPEIKSVAEDLVAGDFNLDFLTGTAPPEGHKADEPQLGEDVGSDKSSGSETKKISPS